MRTTNQTPWRTAGALAVVVACVAALVGAPAAAAHSVLIRTEPANDVVVADSPEHVALHFDEPVETALGSVRVYDTTGERVDDGEIERPEPEAVAVGIDDELERGTYTVTWRVISADSDPISGAFVFHVGERGGQPGGIADEVAQDTPASVEILYPTVRFVDYVLLLLCAGGALALALVLPVVAAAVRRRLYVALAMIALALVPAALASLVLQGAQGGGFGLRDALAWDVVSAVAGTRFGEMSLVRAGLAGVLALVAFGCARQRLGRAGPLACVALGAALLATPAASGHASVAGAVALTADYAHLLAAAAWTGGLGFLVAALLLSGPERWSLASRSVPRFSNLAVASVGLLLAAGAVNGYLQVRTWRGLWDTEYGLLLSAKVLLVVPLLGLGAFNNRFAVPKLRAGNASPVERRRFLRAVGAELVVMTAIVAVTAVLVNAPPAYKEVAMHGGPIAATVEIGPYRAHVTVEPGMPGPNHVELEFETEGGGPDEVVILATLPSEEIGPLRFSARDTGEGTWVVEDADLSVPGEWELRIEAREGEFDLYTHTLSTSIERKP